jgi:hypothetical protein
VAATAFEVNILKRPTILSPVLHTNLRKGEINFKIREQFMRSCVTNAEIDGCSVKKTLEKQQSASGDTGNWIEFVMEEGDNPDSCRLLFTTRNSIEPDEKELIIVRCQGKSVSGAAPGTACQWTSLLRVGSLINRQQFRIIAQTGCQYSLGLFSAKGAT